jgi:hypothetical protein
MYSQKAPQPAQEAPSARITASVNIEGMAEEVLAAVQRLRGCKRTAHLVVEVAHRDYSVPYHSLPEIKDGQIQNALEKLGLMSSQTVIDQKTEKRLEELIREFGHFTVG